MIESQTQAIIDDFNGRLRGANDALNSSQMNINMLTGALTVLNSLAEAKLAIYRIEDVNPPLQASGEIIDQFPASNNELQASAIRR